MRRYVVGFAFHDAPDPRGAARPKARKVLLVRKARPEWQKGLLNGPGGKIRRRENPYDAMTREWREETGHRASIGWSFFASLHGAGFVVHFFRAPCPEEFDPATPADEPAQWYRLDRVQPVNMIPNLRWLLQMAHESQRPQWPFQVRENSQ